MSDKRKMIEEMLEMQRQFIDYEQTHGVSPVDYWVGEEGHPLHGYKDKYEELATKVVDMAHSEKESRR